LTSASIALGETVVVVAIPDYRPSSTRVHITVTQQDKPATAISIEAYREGDHGASTQFWTGLTDSKGVVSLPKLRAGRYLVIAKTATREAKLFIEARTEAHQASHFEVQLVRSDGLDVAEKMPTTVRVRDFRGEVQDITSAVISRAVIKIFRKDSIDSGPILQIESDSKGQFAGHLAIPGEYVAVVKSPGFKQGLFVFGMDDHGWNALRVTMQVGGSSGLASAVAELEGK
jgi:hypothetical protein